MQLVEMLSQPMWQRLTWSLLHFLWQGLIVTLLLIALLRLLRLRRAQSRYAICLAALVAMAACPLATLLFLVASTNRGIAQRGLEISGTAPQLGERAPSASPRAHQPNVALSADTASSALAPEQSDAGPISVRSSVQWRAAFSERVRLLQPYFLFIWAVGVVVLGLRLLTGYVGTLGLRTGCRPIPWELASRLSELIERLGLRAAAPIFESCRVREAIVVGLLRPAVLLPVSWLTAMTPEVLEAVIAHELAHIRRWDLWVNLFQRLVETLLFYHPAVWWLSHRVRVERELCCDESAAAATGKPLVYATALELVGRLRLAATAPQLGAAIGGTKMRLLRRIRYVLGISSAPQAGRWWPVGISALLVPLAIGLGLLGPPDRNRGESVETVLTDSKKAAELLGAFKAAENDWTQAEVAAKLIELGDKSVVPDLVEMLKGEDRRARCNAGRVLAALGDERGLAAVLAELNDAGQRPTKMIRSDGKPNVPGQIQSDRYYAAHVLGQIGNRRAVPALIETLKDKSISYQAAIVLGKLGDQHAVPPLKEMLKSDLPKDRLWAGHALGKLKDPAGLTAVAAFLKDPQWTQRRHAAESLAELADKRGVAPLMEALKDAQPEVRVSAARALGSIADESAIAALERLLNDGAVTTSGPPTVVRDAAAEAIRRIRGEPRPAPGADAAAWGPAVEGLQLRVRAEKPAWPQGSVPKLSADLRNRGKHNLRIALESESWELQIDGTWHKMDTSFSGDREYLPFAPGQEQRSVGVWIADVDNLARKLRGLEPGKHTLRVARLLNSTRAPGEEVLRVVSNPIEIETVAAPLGAATGATGKATEPAKAARGEAAPDAKPAGAEQPLRGRVSGKVLNAATGEPISGAYVAIDHSGDAGGSNLARFREQGIYVTAETDQRGQFVLDGVALLDRHPLLVTHPGFVRHEQTLGLTKDNPQVQLEVRLKPATTLIVAAVEADGKPLQGKTLMRLEANQGRPFVPPREDWPKKSYRIESSTDGKYSFGELDEGVYSLDVMRQTPSVLTYHAGMTDIALKAGETKRLQLTPAKHRSRVTLEIAEDPHSTLGNKGMILLISRNPGLLAWSGRGRFYHPEDHRLGRVEGEALVLQPLFPAAGSASFQLQNFPAGKYVAFALTVGMYRNFGSPAACLRGAAVEIAPDRDVTVKIPWAEPQEPSWFRAIALMALDTKVALEARQYRAEELCELLSKATGSKAQFSADSSIQAQKVSVARATSSSIWELLESLYLQHGWIVTGEESTFVLQAETAKKP